MRGAIPSSNEVTTSSVAKEAMRELPSKGANITNMSQGTSALPKDKGPTPTSDSGKAVVTKRQHSDTPSSPGYHNVYVRRKVESEHNKVNSSQEQKGNGRDKTKEQEAPLQDVQHDEINKVHDEVNKVQHDEVNKVQRDELNKVQHDEANKVQHDGVKKLQHDEVNKVQHAEVNNPKMIAPVDEPVEVEQLSSLSSAKPNVETVPEKTEPPDASSSDIKDNTEQLSIQYWTERFNRLQNYLENCDRSTQEGYLRKLRSLSAAGRSMHAIELEKRAIHLLVEEGKELQRMKALNVLGKVSPNASSKQSPLQRQFQK